MNLAPCRLCRLCRQTPELIDARLVFFVRCTNHSPPWPVVYGQSYRHIDQIDNDAEAQAATDAVDWDAVKASAVDAWNLHNDIAQE